LITITLCSKSGLAFPTKKDIVHVGTAKTFQGHIPSKPTSLQSLSRLVQVLMGTPQHKVANELHIAAVSTKADTDRQAQARQNHSQSNNFI